MRGKGEQSSWDKWYLLVFALLEGTRIDGFVRGAIGRLERAQDLEPAVKNFYIDTTKKYLKSGVGFLFFGLAVHRQIFSLFLLLCMVVDIMAPFWDLRKEMKERSRALEQEYVGMVSKLLLYMGAGLSIRNAYEKTEQALSKGKGKNFLYHEMKLCLSHMDRGQLETDCYYLFGQRCELPEYLRLGGLLAQNARKGNSELRTLLEGEVIDARERQRHKWRRQGEMASTKLLGPMMLLLAMVLIMIMIPALGNLA